MSDFVTCASCGARNGTEAVWCSMCFEPLQGEEPISRAAVEAAGGAPADVTTVADASEHLEAAVMQAEAGGDPDTTSMIAEVDGRAGADHETTWTCGTCESVNPMSADVCAVCGTTIFVSMGAETSEVTLTQDQGLRLALIPGLAHARLGEPVLGFIVGVLVVACLLFAVLFIQSGGPLWGLIVGIVGLLTWGVSAFDVNQRVQGSPPILRPRIMTILGGVVILVIMIAGFVAGATAVQSPGS